MPKPGTAIEKKQVIEYCRERLAKFKVPADVVTVDALPRNATGKVLKRELRGRFAGGGEG